MYVRIAEFEILDVLTSSTKQLPPGIFLLGSFPLNTDNLKKKTNRISFFLLITIIIRNYGYDNTLKKFLPSNLYRTLSGGP